MTVSAPVVSVSTSGEAFWTWTRFACVDELYGFASDCVSPAEIVKGPVVITVDAEQSGR